ncbi:unnamed protein product [Brassica napus]|uniref:(rape) hypothetical protein n=1 Tax=Brassica napus TaxID=3708 RepID=A0A816PZU7_BRANA|nr:unnamed protein product [Brassica napus]
MFTLILVNCYLNVWRPLSNSISCPKNFFDVSGHFFLGTVISSLKYYCPLQKNRKRHDFVFRKLV